MSATATVTDPVSGDVRVVPTEIVARYEARGFTVKTDKTSKTPAKS